MANKIEIAVTLDEKGVVTGVQNIGNALDKIPARAKPAFDGMTKGQLEARNALNGLGYTLGIQLPGEISKSIAKIPLLAGAISGLGEISAIAVLVTGFTHLATHIDEVRGKIAFIGQDLEDFYERSSNLFSGDGFSAGVTGLTQQAVTVSKIIQPLANEVQGLTLKASSAGLTGAAAIHAQAQAQIDALKEARNELLKATAENYPGTGTEFSDTYNQAYADAYAQQAKGVIAIEKQEQAEILALRRDTLDQIAQDQAQANEAALTGFQLMIKQEQDAIDRRNKQLTKMGIGSPDVLNAADTAISSKTTGQIELQGKQWAEQIDNMVAQVQQSSLQGFFAIDIKIGAQQAKLIEDFTKQWGNFDPYPIPHNQQDLARESEWIAAGKKLEQGLTAIAKAGEYERTRMMRQNNDAVADATADAARSTLPPWVQANQEIVDNFNKTVRGIQEQWDDTKLSDPQAKALYAAALEETNSELVQNFRETRDELAGQIESVFDDITSGNLRQAVLGELKHLFSEILAQWALTVNGMRSSGGGQGILGSILSSLFGGGQRYAPIGAGTIPLFGSEVGTSSLLSLGAAAPLALGATSLTSGLTSPFGASAGAGIAGLANPFASSLGLSAGAGTASVVSSQANAQAANTLIGSTLEQSLSKIFPHGLSIGGLKISGAALAGIGAGVGLESLFSAYSSGNPTIGGIGTAAGGALLGFSFGGPLGAVVGGVIGGIAGLFSGLLGKKKHQQEAYDFISNTVSPEIDDIISSYQQFSTDQQDAMSQLTDLENQAKQQLDQLGQDKLYWSTLVPQISDAEKQINSTQAIRDQRASLNFAPPQFAGGGTVPGVGPVPIVAHGGEEIIRQPYASIYRGALKDVNAGNVMRAPKNTSPGVQQFNLNFTINNPMDSSDIRAFFINHGDKIREAIRASMVRNYNDGYV